MTLPAHTPVRSKEIFHCEKTIKLLMNITPPIFNNSVIFNRNDKLPKSPIKNILIHKIWGQQKCNASSDFSHKRQVYIRLILEGQQVFQDLTFTNTKFTQWRFQPIGADKSLQQYIQRYSNNHEWLKMTLWSSKASL